MPTPSVRCPACTGRIEPNCKRCGGYGYVAAVEVAGLTADERREWQEIRYSLTHALRSPGSNRISLDIDTAARLAEWIDRLASPTTTTSTRDTESGADPTGADEFGVEPDLSKCPECGGPADNGHDRCLPPNPYACTKCEEAIYRRAEPAAPDLTRPLPGDWSPRQSERSEAMSGEKRERGLYRRFHVTRTDGSSEPGGKHDGCDYFVLDLTHDRYAAPALRAYAEACAEEYPALAADLRRIAGAATPPAPPAVSPEATEPGNPVVRKAVDGLRERDWQRANGPASPDAAAPSAQGQERGQKRLTRDQAEALLAAYDNAILRVPERGVFPEIGFPIVRRHAAGGYVWTACPECGVDVSVDEDGCCVTCGADALWHGREATDG